VGDYYGKFFLFFNKIEYFGLENIVKDKPGIIAPNHAGSAKDIFVMYEIFKQMDTQLFFAARDELFDKSRTFEMVKKHLETHTGILSSFVPDWRLDEFSEFCSSSLESVGTIPCDLNHKGISQRDKRKSNYAAIKKMEEYVGEMGRKIVVFQFDKEKVKADRHAFFHGAKKGAAIVAKSAYNDYGLVVPMYPVAIMGSKGLMPWYMITELRRKPIKVSIGQPLEITSFINEKNPVESMKEELESKIRYLLRDLARREDKGQILYPSKEFRLRDFFSTLLTKGEKRNLIYPGRHQSQTQSSPYESSSQNK
jgi:hypothetical protein